MAMFEVARLVMAEVDRRVAIEVALQVQNLLEESRLLVTRCLRPAVKHTWARGHYRFTCVLERSGVEIPRQSLARSVINVSKLLQPLHDLARDALLDSAVIHMGETTIQVLKEPDKAPTSQSYIWVQRGGPPGKPVILYDYDPSRSGHVPLRLLEGWRGCLMTSYRAHAARAADPDRSSAG